MPLQHEYRLAFSYVGPASLQASPKCNLIRREGEKDGIKTTIKPPLTLNSETHGAVRSQLAVVNIFVAHKFLFHYN